MTFAAAMLLVGATLALGYVLGRRRGAAHARAEYASAYAALADGKLPPAPEPKVVERVVHVDREVLVEPDRCRACGDADRRQSRTCSAGSCAKCCHAFCTYPACQARR
jgi:hypothetical protein